MGNARWGLIGGGVVFLAAALRGEAVAPPAQQPDERVAALEARVARLERRLRLDAFWVPASVPMAEQNLAVALRRLELAERQAVKGYITPAELRVSQRGLERARRQLAVTRGEASLDSAWEEMEEIEAQHRLDDAGDQLRIAEKMTRAGLGSQLEVDAARLALERAQIERDQAKTTK